MYDLVLNVHHVVKFDNVRMIQKFHRFQFAWQKLLLKVDRRALLVDNLQSYSAPKFIRQRPFYLNQQSTNSTFKFCPQ